MNQLHATEGICFRCEADLAGQRAWFIDDDLDYAFCGRTCAEEAAAEFWDEDARDPDPDQDQE